MKELYNAALEEAYKAKIQDLFNAAFTSSSGSSGNLVLATRTFSAGAALAEQLYTLLKQ